MPTDDRNVSRDLDLDAYWERVVRGERASPKHLDPSLATTVSRLHARDATPGPDAAFVGRLWGDLMQTTVPSDRALIVPAAPPSPNGHAPRLATSVSAAEPVRLPRTRPVAAFATAAILLLTLVSGFGAYRLATPNSGRAPTALVAFQEGTPDAATCSLPPRSRPIPTSGTPELSLNARYQVRYSLGDAVFDEIVHPSDLQSGTPADASVVAGIRTTLAQVSGCFTLGNNTLFSDDYFRRGSGIACPPNCRDGFWIPAWLVEPGTVRSAHVLPDGRVGVIVNLTPSQIPMFFVFVEQDDRWLIDEVATIEETGEAACLTDGRSATPAAIEEGAEGTVEINRDPAASYSGRIYVVEVNRPEGGDILVHGVESCATPSIGAYDGNIYVGEATGGSVASGAHLTWEVTIAAAGKSFTPSALSVFAHTPLLLTIENRTAKPIGFMIDELGINLRLDVGDTRGITLTPPPGVYTYYSDLPGQREAGMVGTLTVE